MNITRMDSLDPAKYIRTDNGTLIHERAILWMRRVEECIHLCSRTVGCSEHPVQGNTHRICKDFSPETYNRLKRITDPTE